MIFWRKCFEGILGMKRGPGVCSHFTHTTFCSNRGQVTACTSQNRTIFFFPLHYNWITVSVPLQGLLQLLGKSSAQLKGTTHANCSLCSTKTFSKESLALNGLTLFYLQFYMAGQRKCIQNPPKWATQVKKTFISAGSVTTWEILLMALSRNAVNAHRVAVC